MLVVLERAARPSSSLSTQLTSERRRPASMSSAVRHFVCAAMLLVSVRSVAASTRLDERVTATVNSTAILNCRVDFPDNLRVPYIIHWEKDVKKKDDRDRKVFIFYQDYDPHVGPSYAGRVELLKDTTGQYGQAAIKLSNVKITDRGRYVCNVLFADRSPMNKKTGSSGNGTVVFLDVHAAPRIVEPPRQDNYVKLGESIILSCVADGTPTPIIEWFKEAQHLDPARLSQSPKGKRVKIANQGMELRISDIRQEDLGDYTCMAKNGVPPHASSIARIMLAGSARIIRPPENVTKSEGVGISLTCGAQGQPENITVRWLKDGTPINEIESLDTRVKAEFKPPNYELRILPLAAGDSGKYTCEVTNGIGGHDSASAWVDVEYPARVVSPKTTQYLPFRMNGIVECPIDANPPLQFITWTKDARIFKPTLYPDVVELQNGSLLFQKVSTDHQGTYRCTPYNALGTKGRSPQMVVLVRDPPNFVRWPKESYERKLDSSVTMECMGSGTPTPAVKWRRRDGKEMPQDRARIETGNLTIAPLRREDHGYYECVVSNEIATVVRSTLLVVQNTPPHSPYNVSVNTSSFGASVTWLPGYSGGDEESLQYIVWYKENTTKKWSSAEVTPPKALTFTIYRLQPSTTYEFQVLASNKYGRGLFSELVTARTKDAPMAMNEPAKTTPKPGKVESKAGKQKSPAKDEDHLDYRFIVLPTDATGSTYYPQVIRPQGPKPGVPRNVTVFIEADEVVITWLSPNASDIAIAYLSIEYKQESSKSWKPLNQRKIDKDENRFESNEIVGGRTYLFRVVAHTLTNSQPSDEFKFSVPASLNDKSVTGGIVGGVLFFVVAIILSICAVKICNNRRRRRQERAYNMVSCRVTDSVNGGHPHSPVPFKSGQSRISVVISRLAANAGNSFDRFLTSFPPNANNKNTSSSGKQYGVQNRRNSASSSNSSRRRKRRSRRRRRELGQEHPHYSVEVIAESGSSVGDGSSRHQVALDGVEPVSDGGYAPGGRRFVRTFKRRRSGSRYSTTYCSSSSDDDDGGFLSYVGNQTAATLSSSTRLLETGVYHVGGSGSNGEQPSPPQTATATYYASPVISTLPPGVSSTSIAAPQTLPRRPRPTPSSSTQWRDMVDSTLSSSGPFGARLGDRSFPSTIMDASVLNNTNNYMNVPFNRRASSRELPSLRPLENPNFAPHAYSLFYPAFAAALTAPHHYYPYNHPSHYVPVGYDVTASGRHLHQFASRSTGASPSRFGTHRSGIMGHLQPPRIADIASPNPNPVYENVPVPQRPLATSSPPRWRAAARQPRGQPTPVPYRQHHSAPPPLFRRQQSPLVVGGGNTDVFESSGEMATQESSSGFGSRNTTSQNTQSSSSRSALMDNSLSPSTTANLVVLAPSLHVPSPRLVPPLDISADDHYEFDAIHVDDVPDAYRTDRGLSDSEILVTTTLTARRTRSSPGTTVLADTSYYVNEGGKAVASGFTSLSLSPTPTSEDMEARLRAMREEFHLYRQRQLQDQQEMTPGTIRRRGPVLESAC